MERILLVEDDAQITASLSAFLQSEGFAWAPVRLKHLPPRSTVRMFSVEPFWIIPLDM